MVITCCVRGCRSENFPGCGISFHAFPQDSHIKRQWVRVVQRENWKPSQHSRICSKHFERDFFNKGKKRNTLHKDAIPTFTHYNADMQKLQETTRSTFSSSPDRSSLPDPKYVTTVIEKKRSTLDSMKSLKNPVLILKSPSGITSFDGKLAKIFLKQRERSAKLLKRLQMSKQMCKRLESKVVVLEDEIKQLKSKNSVSEGAPMVLTLSNGMYEKETLTIRVARSKPN